MKQVADFLHLGGFVLYTQLPGYCAVRTKAGAARHYSAWSRRVFRVSGFQVAPYSYYRTMLRIRNSHRTQDYSVQFDDNAKRKIHHHFDQVLDIFNKLEVEDTKRGKLIDRLSDLQNEVNQRRTRFDRLAALTIEVSSVVGEAVEKSKLLEILDAIGRVFWGAQTERQKQLPGPKDPKTLEPPKPKPSQGSKPVDDDDIPF